LISIAIGIPAGRALGMHNFRGKRLVEFSILAPPIVPGLAVVMGIHVAFIKFGLADTMPGVILVHLIPTTPYMVMVLAGVFANYNPEFEEQARVLGAGPAATFRHVTLPAILPGVVVGGLFAFIISWSQYVLSLLIGGGNVLTLPVLLFTFAGAGDNAITAALAVTFIAPAIAFLILTSRFLTGESTAVGGFGGGV
jgi:putative spermidine/putrescine transport system permease protein